AAQSAPPQCPPHTTFADGESTFHVGLQATRSSSSVFVAPQVRPAAHAFADAERSPPWYRRLPQIRRRLHVCDEGVVLDGSANARASSTAPCVFRNPAPSVSGSHAGYTCAVY